MADDDALLAVALDDDEGLDVDALVLFLEGFNDDFDGVGDLLLIVEEDLLTDDLGDEEARGAVGQCVLLEVGRRGGDEALDALLQGLDIEVVERRDGDDLRLRKLLVPALHELDELILGREVYLINKEEYGALDPTDALEEELILIGRLDRVGDVEKDVSITESRLGELEHALLELVVRAQYPRGVAIDDLQLGGIDNAHNAVTRRLGLGGDDRYALADQEVHQGGLPYVGVAHDIDEA